MKRSSGARLSATVAVSVLSLALVSGCSDDGSDDSTTSGSSSESAKATSTKVYTAAELEKLLLTTGGIAGYEVDSAEDTLPKSQSELKVDNADCEAFTYATAALPPGDTEAYASNSVTETASSESASDSQEELTGDDYDALFDIDATYVGLSSYEDEGAAEAFKAVSDGAEDCAGGYGYTADGEATKVTKVSEEKASGAGDESVAYAVETDVEDEGTGVSHIEVVRHGNTLATYYTVNFGLLTSEKAYDVPAAVIDAQGAKIK